MNRTTRPTAAEVRHDEVHPIDEPPPWDGEDIDPAWWHELDAAAAEADDGEPWGLDDLVCLNEVEVDGTVRTLADFLSDQSSYYSSIGTAAGRWLASELLELARQARGLNALTVETFNSRREQADASRAEDLIHAGYTRGLADGRADGPGLSQAFGTPA